MGRRAKGLAKELNADKEVVLAAVRQNGLALQYASKDLRGDREVVLEAIRQNAGALEYASEELRVDREVVQEAVKKLGETLKSSPEEPATETTIIDAKGDLSKMVTIAEIAKRDDQALSTFTAASGKHFAVAAEGYPVYDDPDLPEQLGKEILGARVGDLVEVLALHNDWGYGRRFKERVGNVNEGVFRIDWVDGLRLTLVDGAKVLVEVDIKSSDYGFKEPKDSADSTARQRALRAKRFRRKMEEAEAMWNKRPTDPGQQEQAKAAAEAAAKRLEAEAQKEQARKEKANTRKVLAKNIAQARSQARAQVEDASDDVGTQIRDGDSDLAPITRGAREGDADLALVAPQTQEGDSDLAEVALQTQEADEDLAQIETQEGDPDLAEVARQAQEADPDLDLAASQTHEADSGLALVALQQASGEADDLEEAEALDSTFDTGVQVEDPPRTPPRAVDWRREVVERAEAAQRRLADARRRATEAQDEVQRLVVVAVEARRFVRQCEIEARMLAREAAEALQRRLDDDSITDESPQQSPLQHANMRNQTWQATWERQAAHLERLFSDSSGIESGGDSASSNYSPPGCDYTAKRKFARNLLQAKRTGELQAITEEWAKAHSDSGAITSDMNDPHLKIKRKLLGAWRSKDMYDGSDDMPSLAKRKAADMRQLKERAFRAMVRTRRGQRDSEKTSFDIGPAPEDLENTALKSNGLTKRAWQGGMMDAKMSSELERIADEIAESVQTHADSLKNRIRNGLLNAHRTGADLHIHLDELVDAFPQFPDCSTCPAENGNHEQPPPPVRRRWAELVTSSESELEGGHVGGRAKAARGGVLAASSSRPDFPQQLRAQGQVYMLFPERADRT